MQGMGDEVLVKEGVENATNTAKCVEMSKMEGAVKPLGALIDIETVAMLGARKEEHDQTQDEGMKIAIDKEKRRREENDRGHGRRQSGGEDRNQRREDR